MTVAADTGRPLRVLQLRTLRGGGGGPERTILAYATGGGPPGVHAPVCYLRNHHDDEFTVHERAAALAVDYHEVRESGAIDLRAWRRLRDLVCELRPDVLHCHDYKANALGYWLWRCLPVALISTSHGWADTDRRGRLLYYPADRALLARFPLVVAVSESIRTLLLRAGARAEDVVVVHNAVDLGVMTRRPQDHTTLRESLGIASDAVVLGAVGRLDEEKRIDLLLEAAARLRRHQPRLALLLVGEGSRRQAWTDLAHRLGLADVCRFVGRRDDVPALHHAMDVYVQASRAEGTSNALLEAMAMQTPIVATDVGGTSELIEHDVHGLLVPPGDGGALEQAIGRVLAEPDAAAARARAARARAEAEFSLAVWKERMSATYRDAVARDRGRGRQRSW